ncbi:MAG: tetratricopeptide repeat protein [Verrucomicrobia bacterium]|nr:tetratricopeptide repeat protein [Verrucomicrobiota bacterium]
MLPPTPDAESRNPFGLPSWVFCVAIYAALLAVYSPTFGAAFVWNDIDYVTRADLQSLHGLWRIWFEPGATEQYYPLLHGAFWVEHRLWGDNPLGYHLANIFLHGTSACLLASALRKLAAPGAWLAAGIFALHPVCVESIAWVSEQKNTLSTALFLTAGLLYLHYDQSRRPRTYAWATAVFVLALFAKSLTATLPAALLVVCWWQRGKLSWARDVRPLLSWFAIGAVVSLFTAWYEHVYLAASGPEFALSFVQRGLVAARAAWFYLGKTLWPADLIFIYPRWSPNPAQLWQWAFPAAALVLLAALWWLRRRMRGPLAAILFFGGTLFPVMGFFNLYAFRYSYVADHWQYLPMIGLIVPVAAGLTFLTARWPKVAAPVLALGLFATLGTLSWRQAHAYHDKVTFYQTILDRNPDCWMAALNLGSFFLDAGNHAGAIEQFTRTLRLKPGFAEAHCNLGDALLQQHLVKEAIAQYRKTIELKPDLPEAHNNLASALTQLGRADEAVAEYRQTLRLNPAYAEAHANFAYLLTQLNQPAEAIAHGRKAISLRPHYPDAYNNLASAQLAAGDVAGAIASGQRAIELEPNFPIAYNNLGNALARANRFDEAIAAYGQALKLQPGYAEARINLGGALAQAGRLSEAILEYQAALSTNPAIPEGHNNLGFALLRLGQPNEAIVQFTAALSLRPDFPEARHNLELARQEQQKAAPPK